MKLREYKKNLKKEYESTFPQKETKQKRQFQFKLRYVFATAFGILLLALGIQHLYILGYNAGIERHNEKIRNEIMQEDLNQLIPIDSKNQYDKIVLDYQNKITFRNEKSSILQNLFSLQFIGCSSSKGDALPPPTNTGESSFQTNVQVQGVDESDVAKSDGKYIYYFDLNKLYIYKAETNSVIAESLDDGKELYIFEDKIITLGTKKTRIYEWKQEKLTKKDELAYDIYLTSRLTDGILYLASGTIMGKEEVKYTSCYYDSFSNPRYVYSLIKLNLTGLEKKETQLLSTNEVKLYASSQTFYFAAKEKNITSISMFTLELEPIGVIRLLGTVLNQFSMDEYEGFFRVVTTDKTRDALEMNALSIFDLNDACKRVGYLDQGIGKEYQEVKSVRFDKNTCYIVTYENTDPLYEIDCSNPAEPKIISAYEAPGYSNYLHTFQIKNKEYVLGLGYTDARGSTKISVYEKTNGTAQIGKDFILSYNLPTKDYFNTGIYPSMFENHKALFFYQDASYFYFGVQAAYDTYLMFKIDVEASENVISIQKEIPIKNASHEKQASRAFLIEGILYITDGKQIILEQF